MSQQPSPSATPQPFDFLGADDLLNTYSRNDAVLDGLFIDITRTAPWHRFKFNYGVHLSVTVYDLLVRWDDEDNEKQGREDQDDRLAELLQMFSFCRSLKRPDQLNTNTLTFTYDAKPRDGISTFAQPFSITVTVDVDDDAEPVLTFWLTSESRQ